MIFSGFKFHNVIKIALYNVTFDSQCYIVEFVYEL